MNLIEEMTDGDLHAALGEYSARSTATVADLITAPLTADTWPSEHESTPIWDAINTKTPTPPQDYSAVREPENPAGKAADTLIQRIRGWFW